MKINNIFSIFIILLFFMSCVKAAQDCEHLVPKTATSNCGGLTELNNFIYSVINTVAGEAHGNTQQCVTLGEGPGIFTPVGTARVFSAVIEAMFNVWALTQRYVKTTIAQEEFDDRYPSTTCDVLFQQMYLQGRRIYNFILPSAPLPPQPLLQNISKALFDPFYLPGNTVEQIAQLGSETFELDALLLTNLLRNRLANDGSNQQGCYGDTSNYFPVNPPTNLTTLSTIQASAAGIRDISHWSQEVRYPHVLTPREFLNPQALKIETYSRATGGEFMIRDWISNSELHQEMESLLDYQATLASRINYNRFTCDYWSYDTTNTNLEDPRLPFRSLPAGHWLEITWENVINPQNHPGQTPGCDLGCALRLLLGVSKANYDAAIVAWQNKRIFDTVRPSTYITTFTGYTTPTANQFRGPWCPFGTVQRYQWQPYQALYFITPAFPGFPSGHSTFGAASARVLTLLTGSEFFPEPLVPLLKRGRGKFEYQCFQNGTNYWGESCQYQTCGVDISYDTENFFYPAQDVTLGPFYKYEDAAVNNGYARMFCGVHILADNLQGLDKGRLVGQLVFERVQTLFE